MKMQAEADQTVKRILDNPKTDPKAALVSIDPRNGAVRAMYGGWNFKSAPVQLRHQRHPPGRLDHEAVRARPGAERRPLGQLGVPGPGAADRQRRGLQELRRHQLRPDDPAGRHPAVRQHHLRAAHAAGQARPGGQVRQGPRPGGRARRPGRARTGPAAARGPASAQAGAGPVARLRGRDHPPARLGLRDLGQPWHPPGTAPGREGGRRQGPGARDNTPAAPRAPGDRPGARRHHEHGPAGRGRERHRHRARLFGREVAGKTGHHQRLHRRPVRRLHLRPGHLGLARLRQPDAQAGQRPRPVRGVRRVAAGPDLARLHGPGHPRPAQRVVRAPGRPRRGGAELDHDGPADDRAAQPTQPGNPGQPQPTVPSPTQPGPSLPPPPTSRPGSPSRPLRG